MTPHEAAEAMERAPRLPAGCEERFSGYGVMGLPFSSGHYLALRRFPASSLGPAYTAVWWRDLQRRWTIYADVPPDQSCARYFSRALARAEQRAIDIVWRCPYTLTVDVPGVLSWDLELGETLLTRALSLVGSVAPTWLWRQPAVLGLAGPILGWLLGAGKLRLQGRAPNGQWFQANPRRAWLATSSRAIIHGQVSRLVGPLERQTGLGDLRLPQRGVFFIGDAYFEPSTTTCPASPSTSSSAPVAISRVAPRTPKTAGMPRSRASVAACEVVPPVSSTSPAGLPSPASAPGANRSATSTS
jgi:hypothetical protein